MTSLDFPGCPATQNDSCVSNNGGRSTAMSACALKQRAAALRRCSTRSPSDGLLSVTETTCGTRKSEHPTGGPLTVAPRMASARVSQGWVIRTLTAQPCMTRSKIHPPAQRTTSETVVATTSTRYRARPSVTFLSSPRVDRSQKIYIVVSKIHYCILVTRNHKRGGPYR